MSIRTAAVTTVRTRLARRGAGVRRFSDDRVSAELTAIAERRRAEMWSNRV